MSGINYPNCPQLNIVSVGCLEFTVYNEFFAVGSYDSIHNPAGLSDSDQTLLKDICSLLVEATLCAYINETAGSLKIESNREGEGARKHV